MSNVNVSPLADFCTCLESVVSKDAFVYFSSDAKVLKVHSVGTLGGVSLETPLEPGAEEFAFGVEPKRLISAFKKVPDGVISISMSKAKAAFEIGSIKFDMGIVEPSPVPEFPDAYEFPESMKAWLTSALLKCDFSFPQVSANRVTGILLESSDFFRVAKIGDSCVKVLGSDLKLPEKFQYFISLAMCKVISKFEHKISSYKAHENWFRVELESGVRVQIPNMHYDYPENYLGSFGFKSDSLPSAALDQFDAYPMKNADLAGALDLVSAIMGSDSKYVKMEIIGENPEKSPIWNISGESYGSCSAEEKVVCTAPGNVKAAAFGLNGRGLMGILKTYEEDVILFGKPEDEYHPLYISDSDRMHVTVVAKMRL